MQVIRKVSGVAEPCMKAFSVHSQIYSKKESSLISKVSRSWLILSSFTFLSSKNKKLYLLGKIYMFPVDWRIFNVSCGKIMSNCSFKNLNIEYLQIFFVYQYSPTTGRTRPRKITVVPWANIVHKCNNSQKNGGPVSQQL